MINTLQGKEQQQKNGERRGERRENRGEERDSERVTESFWLERCHFICGFISKSIFRRSCNIITLDGKGLSTSFHNWSIKVLLWSSWFKKERSFCWLKLWGWKWYNVYSICLGVLHMNWVYVKKNNNINSTSCSNQKNKKDYENSFDSFLFPNKY